MPRLILRWFLVPYILASNCVLAQPFFFRKDIRVGEAPYAVIAGDFNGDGRPDLAVGAQDGVYVLLNTGGGNFGRPIRTEAAPATFWLGAAADFNGDGKDDLVGSGFLFLSRGDGTFLPPRYIGAQEAVAAGDFNRDGKTDLVISYYEVLGSGLARVPEGVRLLLGNGDGTFRPGAVVTSTPMIGVLPTADFNRDGLPDVATILLQPGKGVFLLVFLGRGDGTFGPEVRTEIGGTVLVADFNGDRLPDIFTQTFYGSGHQVMLGKGDGSFQSPFPYAGVVSGHAVAAADFTGDGYADLVMTVWHRAGRRSYICPGKGDGTLLPPVEQSASVSWAVTAVDVDADGRFDLAATNESFTSVSLLMYRAEGGPALRRAVSAAVDIAIVTPGSLATLYTPAPAMATESASPPWPTRLGGISLEVRDSAGATRLAPLLSVSPTQINFQVPAAVALGEATLAIVHGGGTTLAGSMEVDAVAPALFPTFTGVLVEPDGTQVSAVAWIPLSTAGDRPIYLSFYGTGFRGAGTANVTCSVNGVPVPVLYAGPQQTPGLDQINIQLLTKVLETNWDPWGGVLVTIRIDGVPANPVGISIF